MVERIKIAQNVVDAARQRVVNIFDNGVPVYLSMSAGKDSICIASIIYDLAREGRIDPRQMTVIFVDEEAVFDEVDRIARLWREKFLALGSKFWWLCIEVKHFNCFNMLTNDESFICWDSTCPERWVRPMKPYAITDHPMLKRRVDTYQSFLSRVTKDGLNITGLRMTESVQRLTAFSPKNHRLLWPLYDWRDTDVWRYISERSLDYPETYHDLYAIGTPRNKLRISQFFSIDTAKVLVRLAETNPDLMERVQRREPNTYLAALYWDSEMFRSVRENKERDENGDEVEAEDYRAKVFEFMANPENYDSKVRRSDIRSARRSIHKFAAYLTQADYRRMYAILVAGDPKKRASRAYDMKIGGRIQRAKEQERERQRSHGDEDPAGAGSGAGADRRPAGTPA